MPLAHDWQSSDRRISITETTTMARCFRTAVIIVVLAGPMLHGGARPPPMARSAQAELDEAARLEKEAEKLRDDGKFQEAIPLAERGLTLREGTLGPMHPDVARGLDDLAALYRERGEYEKAEQLALRALDIREKALGPMHPDVARSLHGLGAIYCARGMYGKALPLVVRGLDIREKALGPMHPDVAHSLNDLALLHDYQGEYDKAEPLYLRSLDIREKALGPLHADVAESLNNLAGLYESQGAYEKARIRYVRALDIDEKLRGPMHPLVATSLNNLAALHTSQAAYGEAEPLYVRALDIRERALGPMHPDVAYSLNNLGMLYKAEGSFAKAEPLLLRALAIREKALGPGHPDVASSVGNLAGLYLQMGAYRDAEPLFIRSLEIREKALGPTHPDVAAGVGNLARLYQEQGTYGRAEPLFLRALDIYEKALGPMHPDVARGLNYIAKLYEDQGASSQAKPLFLRALDIREKALGPMHPDVALSLHNLGDFYRAGGAYDDATPLYVRALDIREKALGPTHPDVAASLNSLAALHDARADYRKARPLLVRALDIREKALGPMHPSVAVSLGNLGLHYQAQRAYGEAEPLLVRALEIDENALGPMHPKLATSLNNLAGLYRAQGAYDRAEPLYVRAAEIREGQLHGELGRLSAPRKRALMGLLQGETESLVSLHTDAAPGSERALRLALTTILRRKGRVLDSLIDNETALRAHLTPRLRDQLDQLTRARAELTVRLYGPAGSSSAIDRAAIAGVRTRIDEVESALSAASADFRALSEPVTIGRIQARLPPDAALVELVRYHRFDPRKAQPWQEERYAAYLLTARGPPLWVALGPAAPIDAEVDAMLAAMAGNAPMEHANAVLRRLHALAFAPIRARSRDVSHLILAPDGKLNLVPFEALVDQQGHSVVEDYLVSYVTSGRDLLSLTAPRGPRSAAVIVAGPDYGQPPPRGTAAITSFTPLAGALGEAADLQRYFSTAPVTGKQATKSSLSALTGPAMLHIATHGFYAQNRPRPPSSGGLSREMFADGTVPLRPPPRTDDPADGLDRAGLAMAGANHGPAGIVTAREIAGFDWWGTQLVVLSGCETGVGAIPSGEGVYGLRRALVLAGAASQVVSLWSVDDSSTRELMRDYYAELARGTGRAEALRQAKRQMMRQPRHAHPYFWAAFIPIGDWRPLDKEVFPAGKPGP
jgi:CHAT domain-containing protein/tetratricopeptide (TPR) repeat protein